MIKVGQRYKYKPTKDMNKVGWIDYSGNQDNDLVGCVVYITGQNEYSKTFNGIFLTGKYKDNQFNFPASCLTSMSFASNYITTAPKNTPGMKEK